MAYTRGQLTAGCSACCGLQNDSESSNVDLASMPTKVQAGSNPVCRICGHKSEGSDPAIGFTNPRGIAGVVSGAGSIPGGYIFEPLGSRL